MGYIEFPTPSFIIETLLKLTELNSVTGEKEYFQLSWNKKKSVKHVQKVIDREGLSLIGKTFGPGEFNAAIPYMRKKKFGEAMELYKFDRKVGRFLNIRFNAHFYLWIELSDYII